MKCNICKSNNIKILYKLKKFNIKKCNHCNLIFTDPLFFKNRDTNLDYEEDYYKELHKNHFSMYKKRKGDYSNNPKINQFRRVINTIEKYSPIGKILDIGCAEGVFLDIAKQKGWDCYGIDISKYATKYASDNFDIKVKTGELNEKIYPNEFFNVITLWDTIEHVKDPNKIILIVNKIIKKDGLLFILTINEDSLINRIAHFIYKLSFGIIKYPIVKLHPIHHLHHFSKKTIKNLLNKHGFKSIQTNMYELPLKSIEINFFMKIPLFFIYFLQKLLNKQWEIEILAKKILNKGI